MATVIGTMTLFGISAGISAEGIGKIVRRAFYWNLALVIVLTIIGLFFWESVRLYWVLASVLAVLGFFLGQAFPKLGKAIPWLWALLWFICTFIILPGFSGLHEGPLRHVEINRWGGMLLTFILAITGIVVSFPLGIALALGRESKLPIIKGICTAYIEIIRGAPLITWLFMASIFLSLILNGVEVAAIVKAQVAIILFAAAYMAENVRGGLQALPKGQGEAAHALGLSGWDTTRLIIMPQALRAVIPAIVGLFIGLFKDTTLVLVVGLIDIFNTMILVSTQPEVTQVTGGILKELFIFGSIFFWFFCYRMSVASRQLEQHLGLGTR